MSIISSIKNLLQKNTEAQQEQLQAAEAEPEVTQAEDAAPAEGKHGDPGVCCGGCS